MHERRNKRRKIPLKVHMGVPAFYPHLFLGRAEGKKASKLSHVY